jgi:uncharacterized protein (DUF305 family)
MNRSMSLTALALVSALTVPGCGTGVDESLDASPETAPAASASGASTASPSGAATAAEISAAHNDADVMFAQAMIPHHEQAVEMSEILLADPDVPPEVRELAQGVIAAQGPEIRRMHNMLETWGEEPVAGSPDMDHGSTGHGSGMAGMMSEEDLGALDRAAGAEAARLYLEQMTAHHEGAVTMARTEVRDGANPETVELAEDVIAAQEAEIAEMQELLRGLPASS